MKTPASSTNDQSEARLWKIARKRAAFKRHLFTYLIVNAFLWALWLFERTPGVPWPVWSTFGWGIGIAFNYFSAYHSDDSLATQEFEKLKREQGGN
jgi:hypothetical protein